VAFDKFHDECGVVGVYNHPEAANLAYLALHALQHRGQESAGIVSSDGEQLHKMGGMGLVVDVFPDEVLAKLPGRIAIGHNRYSTSGGSLAANIQPFMVSYGLGQMALAHNGQLVNAGYIRDNLEAFGSIFQSKSDTEVIIHLIAQALDESFTTRVVRALRQVRGGYALVLMNEDTLVAVRDPWGLRPLVMGEVDGAVVFASETCALDLIAATFVREVAPGEMVVVNGERIDSSFPFPVEPNHSCIFELLYFARPDSDIFGVNINEVRNAFGRQLAREAPVVADLVVPVPDSGVPSAFGYSWESGIPLQPALVRNHYIGRTFIEPSQHIRNFGVRLKLNPVRRAIEGKRVVLIDDSIVRGTTSRKIVKMVRDAGAAEVHMRVSSPPTTNPCFYGVDTPTREELIASTNSPEQIRRHLGADSLAYLSHEGMLQAAAAAAIGFCTACFDGHYPVTPEMTRRVQLELFHP
jgi:amidophosphoribosyltransferase